MRVHPRRQSRVALAGRMLVPQRDINVAVPAPVEQLGKSSALLSEDCQARMPEVVELEPWDVCSGACFLPGRAQGVWVDRQTPSALGVQEPGRSFGTNLIASLTCLRSTRIIHAYSSPSIASHLSPPLFFLTANAKIPNATIRVAVTRS